MADISEGTNVHHLLGNKAQSMFSNLCNLVIGIYLGFVFCDLLFCSGYSFQMDLRK